jgi:aminoglycoside 3-N-acetyltransferase
MHTYESLFNDLSSLRISGEGTLFVHSSMKSIGAVEGGADTVLDALSGYMKDGLLALPTHTWSYINAENPRFYVNDSPSCVGLLTELFRNRPGVHRSLHPTHSVAALGRDAEEFVKGNELFDTPCARGSSYGKLLDRKGLIMLIGVDLRRNTFIHGVEEWKDIPGRLSDGHELLYTVLPDATEITVPSRRHCGVDWSLHFWKVEGVLEEKGAMCKGRFGDAVVRICDTVRMTEILFDLLDARPDLFSDNSPLEQNTIAGL